MVTVLLIVIYIAFIGLGIPDSLFGAAWPAIYADFALPISYASFVTVLISAGTVVSSLFSARIINRFGTGKITAVSTCLTAAALLGFSFAPNLFTMSLLAIPLGLGAGTIDAALNNYVALHFKASHMNFLHCFYGIGVTVGPYLISFALRGGNWRGGYTFAFAIQLVIALITLLSLPLWGKMRARETEDEDVEPVTVELLTLLRQKKARCACLIFLGYCAMEVTAGTWASTFFVNARGLSPEDGAGMAGLYYGGMALGRLLAGLSAGKLTPWQLIKGGAVLSFGAIALLWIPGSLPLAGAALLLLGMGNGPIFPNMVHLTPRSFSRELSQSVVSAQMACAYVGTMLMPPLFGLLAQWLGAALYPWYLLLMFLLMAFYLLQLLSLLKKEGRDTK